MRLKAFSGYLSKMPLIKETLQQLNDELAMKQQICYAF